MNFVNWLLDRLSENSTWRGLIGLATASGVVISPEHADKIIAAGIALVALINIFRKAPPTAPPTPPARLGGSIPVLLVSGLLLGGCATTQTPARVLTTTAQTVDAAMQGWASFVVLKPVPESEQVAVRKAYTVYQSSMAVAETAWQKAQKSGDFTAYAVAESILRANAADLLNLINAFKPPPKTTP